MTMMEVLALSFFAALIWLFTANPDDRRRA